jgi:TonB family protein
MTILRLVRCSCPLVMILIYIGSLPTWCQTKSVKSQIESAYKGKIFLLRNFYSGNDLGYDQNGELLGPATPGPWTLAQVEIKSVTVIAQGIEIVGNRLGVLYKDGEPRFVKVGKLKIHLARLVSEADTEATLSSIFHKIFIEPGEDLRPMVPDYWRPYLAGTDLKSRSAAWEATRRATLEKANVEPIIAADTSYVAPPREIYAPEPKYPKEAASHHIEGSSRMGTVINSSGNAESIVILQALGMGLDEQAVLSLRQWKFQPATKSGRPVRVQINVEIEFRCCP